MRNHCSLLGLLTVSFGANDPCDVTCTSVRVFVSSVRSPLSNNSVHILEAAVTWHQLHGNVVSYFYVKIRS